MLCRSFHKPQQENHNDSPLGFKSKSFWSKNFILIQLSVSSRNYEESDHLTMGHQENAIQTSHHEVLGS